MFCKNCLQHSISKLKAEDIIIIEYLKEKKATIPQCSISRENIRDDLKLTSHKCYTAIARLECFDIISRQIVSKSSRYYVTENGQYVLEIMENKLQGAI